VLYPGLMGSTAENAGQLQELTYIRTIVDYMPIGWKGAMVAFLCAAFMSTMDTHLNWGASYLVRDLYARFIKPGRSQTHYVVMSRVVMVLTALASVLVAILLITSIGDANRFFVGLMAGIGLVFAMRFYWWRVNAWSEISAMVGAVLVNGVLQFWVIEQEWFLGLTENAGDRGALLMMFGALVVNALWITVTLKTQPESREVLHRFYRRVQPPGPGWRKIAAECGMEYQKVDPKDFLAFLGGMMLIWGALYFMGKLLFAEWAQMLVGLAVTLVGGWLVYAFLLKKADRLDSLEGEHDASEQEVMEDSAAS